MPTARDNAISLYMEGIRDGNPRAAVTAYTGDRYTQHSTGVSDGIEGFVAFFEPFVQRNPVRDIRIIRALQDGRHFSCTPIRTSITAKPNGSPRISSTLTQRAKSSSTGM